MSLATPTVRAPAGHALVPQFTVLLRMQLARMRLAWRRYMIVSSAMPLGIVILMRVRGPAPESQGLQFVAGSVVLAVALSALTFLAQRVAWMRAHRVFEYYRTLPTSSMMLLLTIYLAYLAFALPGMVALVLIGGWLFGLPLTAGAALVWTLPTLLLGGIALAGLGALIGLAGRDEQLSATYANLAMMAVLFLGIVPAGNFPAPMRLFLLLSPSTYMVDSLKLGLVGSLSVTRLSLDLLATVILALLIFCWSARVLNSRSEV